MMKDSPGVMNSVTYLTSARATIFSYIFLEVVLSLCILEYLLNHVGVVLFICLGDIFYTLITLFYLVLISLH